MKHSLTQISVVSCGCIMLLCYRYSDILPFKVLPFEMDCCLRKLKMQVEAENSFIPGGTHQQSQHQGGRHRKIRSSRSPLVTLKV